MNTINVVAAVIKHGDKIFATQRGYGEFKGGWEFPGGKVELGEEPEGINKYGDRSSRYDWYNRV